MAEQSSLNHDPDSLRRMALALDEVWEALPDPDRSEATRQRLALFIVDVFTKGERDPQRIAERARVELRYPQPDNGGA